MIVLNSVTKRFGTKVAVDDVSFTVRDGEIVGFLGPNGAGKSTTMNIITGYLSASSGKIVINGEDVFTSPTLAKKNIGFLPELPPLYLDMTVSEYLKFVCDIKGYEGNRKNHIDEICKKTGISHVADRIIKNLSKGYRQRVGIAQALVGDPKVLIFDEPTVGLDPVQIKEIRELIRSLGKNHTVILSTHILPEVQAVCDRVIVINRGRIIADGNTDELVKKTAGVSRYSAELLCDKTRARKILSDTEGVSRILKAEETDEGSLVTFESDASIDARKTLFNKLKEEDVCLLGLSTVSLTLEDIFIKLVETSTKKAPVKEVDYESNI